MRISCAIASAVLLNLLVAASQVSAQTGTGFYRAEGKQITDPSGNPVVPRGIGLGGWLVPEGYMLDIAAPDGGSPSSIRAQIEDLIGPAAADEFYEIYEANYVDEKDIAAIAGWGADHVRLPFHYKRFYDSATGSFKEDGFALLDTFLDWCRTYGLAVVLDMHAAPGGQNDGNISDSDGVARLWTEPVPYQNQTVEIWTEIARRYADEPLIMGYDLLNEPVTPEGYFDDLWPLYSRIADAIRQVDPNHILFIEGNYYATTFPEEPPFDDNMVYAFHKYWNATDTGSINYLLQLRDRDNVPLWLGETGENSNHWYHNVARLSDRHDIGINWWTHKQIEATASVLSAPYAPGYEDVLEYWRCLADNRPSCTRPSPQAATFALFAMAEGLDLDSCEVRIGVKEAQFNLGFGSQRQALKDHSIPGVVEAADYDVGLQWNGIILRPDEGMTYFDTDYQAITGRPGGGNTGTKYRNDGVDIELSADAQGSRYSVGWTEAGEWMTYTVDVETTGVYDVDFRVASPTGSGRLSLGLQGEFVGTDRYDIPLGELSVESTGGWYEWETQTLATVSLPAGEHILKLKVLADGANVNRMTFRLVQPTFVEESEGLPQAAALLEAYPNPFANRLTLRLQIDSPAEIGVEMFDVLGRRVYSEMPRAYGPGEQLHSVQPDLGAGVYFVRVRVGQGSKRSVLTSAVVYGL